MQKFSETRGEPVMARGTTASLLKWGLGAWEEPPCRHWYLIPVLFCIPGDPASLLPLSPQLRCQRCQGHRATVPTWKVAAGCFRQSFKVCISSWPRCFKCQDTYLRAPLSLSLSSSVPSISPGETRAEAGWADKLEKQLLEMMGTTEPKASSWQC